jgi:hypothetical protein
MSMMFFYFLKIIFDINISKQFKKYKTHLKFDESQLHT